MQNIFFAFDDQSIPSTSGLELHMQQPEKHPANPIIPRGPEGTPDATRCQCAAVLREGDRWRLYYSAHDGAGVKGDGVRVACAESNDGRTWRKPELGLVEYNGTRRNNLVDAQPGLNTVAVLRDPDAPPERRYAMAGEDMRWWGAGGWSLVGPSCTRVDISPDGLHWSPVLDRPGLITPQHEAKTLYRFNNHYHLGGHQISPLLRLPMQEHPLGFYLGPRTFVVWRSPQLDRWPLEPTRAFFKPMRSSSPYRTGWDREEVHLGATVTPYANVCLGIYGQWHHPIGRHVSETERETAKNIEGGCQTGGDIDYFGPDVSVDLGLILSNDGIHFREPAPGFTFIGRDQELAWDRDYRDNTDADAILLGQGSIVNAGDRTFIYYSASTPGGNTAGNRANIGMATLPRDRFGCLRALPGETTGSLATKELSVTSATTLHVNADVPVDSSIRISLVDADGLDTLPGYEADNMCAPSAWGLATPVQWNSRETLPENTPFRIRIELSGNAALYAVYI